MTKIILIVLFFIIVLLFWFNRGHPKIQETFITATAGLIALLLGVIFFSQDVINQKEISRLYFKSNKEGKIIFFNTPILSRYHLQENIIWGNFLKRKPEQEKIFVDLPSNVKYLLELESTAVLCYLFEFYSGDWYIKRESESFPGLDSTRGRRLDIKNKDVRSFSKEDLSEIFKTNIFYPDLIDGLGLSLPKGTIIKYQPYSEKDQYCQIQFNKPLYFDIKIKMHFSSYVVGLGNMSYYTGISKPQQEEPGEAYFNKDYGTVVIKMECTAVFNKIMAGNPDLLRYKEWSKNLFDDLFNEFDWSVCNGKIMEYKEDMVYQKIICKGDK